MKKIALLILALCGFATVSWGQKDTIRFGEGPYDYPYVWDTLFSTSNIILPHKIGNDVPVMPLYVPDNPKMNVIYGIGIVASYDSRNAKWGAKLYSSVIDSLGVSSWCYEDTLQCEQMIPYTPATPYSYFQITAWDKWNQVERDTVVCIYDFYFDAPYYADSGERLYITYYDSLYDEENALHPKVYLTYVPSSQRQVYLRAISGSWSDRAEHFNRSCDSLPYCVTVIDGKTSYYYNVFPITTPPPAWDTVPVCDGVTENLRFVRQAGRKAVVQWDVAGHAGYSELRWGRYTVDSLTGEIALQDGRVVHTYADTALLNVADTGWFACCVRAVCEHECYYHDVTDYGDWSDTLYFYMAPPAPDTAAIAAAPHTLQARVAPNPVQGSLTVSVEQSDDYSVEVYNAMGQRLLTETFSGTEHRLDVARLPKGHYILFLAGRHATTRLPFVKH